MINKLYVCRPVVNGADLLEWAQSIGLKQCLPADDLHVTICFSKEQFDHTVLQPADDMLTVPLQGRREFTVLGEGALVVKFESEELSARHQQFRDAGASWDWPSYMPHVTLTYEAPPGFEPEDFRPFLGPIILGPERWRELDENWKEKVQTVPVESQDLTKRSMLDAIRDFIKKHSIQPRESVSNVVPVFKANDELRTVWGWASIIEQDGKPVTDHHGDIIYEKDLVEAAHDYITESRAAKSMHIGKRTGRVVESLVFTKELQAALGIDLGMVGWLIAMKVEDDKVWRRFKSGELKAFSVGGTGIREKL